MICRILFGKRNIQNSFFFFLENYFNCKSCITWTTSRVPFRSQHSVSEHGVRGRKSVLGHRCQTALEEAWAPRLAACKLVKVRHCSGAPFFPSVYVGIIIPTLQYGCKNEVRTLYVQVPSMVLSTWQIMNK